RTTGSGPSRSTSAAPRARWATCSAARARWRPSSASWRSRTTSSRPRLIWSTRTTGSGATTSLAGRKRRASTPCSPTASGSGEPTRRCVSPGARTRGRRRGRPSRCR
ncbi:hypothetical protein KEM52_005919, partial [Ascosphaera acerosa]